MTKTGHINLRVDPDFKEELIAAAKADGRSLTNYILHTLQQELAHGTNAK